MRRLRIILWIVTIAFAAGVTTLILQREPLEPPRSPMLDQPVPATDLPGPDPLHPGLSDADLRQGTVTVVNLFASWCLPCQVEAPQLRALADGGAVIHGIAVADKPADIAAFLRKHGDPFRRIGLDPHKRAYRAWRASGIPETFVVDGTGRIILHHRGDIRPEHVPVILATIDQARR